MSLKKLAGQTAIYGISSIAARMLNYFLTPYLTYILSPKGYGVVTVMYALIPLALVLLTLGLETGYFRFAGRAADGREKRALFASTWGTVCLLAAVFTAAVVWWAPGIATIAGYGEHPSFVWIVGIIIGIDAVTALPFCKLREEGRAGRFVVLKVVSVVINVVLCLFFYSVLPGAAGKAEWLAWAWNPGFGQGYVFVANAVASGVTLLLLLPSTGTWPQLSWRVVRPVLIYSLPLLLSGIAGTANEYIDRVMIKALLPADVADASVGIYGAVVKVGVILLLFTQVYRYSAEPYFLSGIKREEFTRMNAEAMKYFVLVSIVIFLGITLFTDAFALLIGKDFREGMYILPVVLVSNIVSGVVFNLSFWYKQSGRTKFALAVTGTGLVFTAVFNVLLVPSLGYFGAALARLACEVAMVTMSYRLNRRYSPTPYDTRRIGEYALAGAALFGAGTLTGKWPALLMYGCNAALLAAFCLYAAWREGFGPGRLYRILVTYIKK
jgi:O-antigen/teichoic acid export membrane protein